MIKGVNKQIVEINYTRDDYIERAILFINPEKSKLPKPLLDRKAEDYMKTLLPEKKQSRRRPRRLNRTALLLALAAGLLTALLTALLIFLL